MNSLPMIAKKLELGPKEYYEIARNISRMALIPTGLRNKILW